MNRAYICPFFGVKESICNLGCGYISEKEAEKIVKSCIMSFDSCNRYQELIGESDKKFPYIIEKFQNLLRIF